MEAEGSSTLAASFSDRRMVSSWTSNHARPFASAGTFPSRRAACARTLAASSSNVPPSEISPTSDRSAAAMKSFARSATFSKTGTGSPRSRARLGISAEDSSQALSSGSRARRTRGPSTLSSRTSFAARSNSSSDRFRSSAVSQSTVVSRLLRCTPARFTARVRRSRYSSSGPAAAP